MTIRTQDDQLATPCEHGPDGATCEWCEQGVDSEELEDDKGEW